MAVVWGADTALTTRTTVDNVTEEFLGTIDMAAGLSAHIQLEVDNESGSIIDALIVAVYTTLDASAEVWDDAAFMQFSILPSVITLERHAFVVSGVYKFRIGVLSSGGTDLYTAGGDYRVRTA